MKNVLKTIIVLVITAVIAGFIYWQFNKKKIVRQSIENALAKKTDSLYYIHYDSSHIDEINGNVSFYNVVLQSDSAQKALLNSTDSLPNTLYNIRVKAITASAIDMSGLLQKENVAAKRIVLTSPVIQIIHTGSDNARPFTIGDTMALYQKILGKFKSIKADTIQVTNGTLLITNKAREVQTTLENVNITLSNFLVDSTKDYNSIVPYFVKDLRATVENIQLPPTKDGNRINLEKVDYNAARRYLYIAGIKQYQRNNTKPVIDLRNIKVTGLNTDAFILQQQLKAGQLDCDGGLITIYLSKKVVKDKPASRTIELSADLIDQAQVAGINLGNTRVIIADKNDASRPPFILNNTRFKVTRMLKIENGTNIDNLINNAEWELSADGFSVNTKDGLYKVSLANFIINNAASSIKIKNFSFTPLLSEQQYVSRSKFQHDQYNFKVTDISFSGVNIKKLIVDKQLEAEGASFQPSIKIFNDRTLPPDNGSQLGKFPHESLLKLDFPIYIHTSRITNGLVSYRERAEDSKLIGNVFFSSINATVQNITNIPAYIRKDGVLKLNATAKFLGTGSLSTEWQLFLNAGDGKFRISGALGAMKAASLNAIIEPLSMASAKSGDIDKVTFVLNGSDTKANADILFLYRDLKMAVLKKGSNNELKKKGLLSLLANMLVKNDNTNPANHKIVNYERDITRSFFNLVWKTIFTGAKNTALGKK